MPVRYRFCKIQVTVTGNNQRTDTPQPMLATNCSWSTRLFSCWAYFLFFFYLKAAAPCPSIDLQFMFQYRIRSVAARRHDDLWFRSPWDFTFCFTWCARVTALLYRLCSVSTYNTIYLSVTKITTCYYTSLRTELGNRCKLTH